MFLHLTGHLEDLGTRRHLTQAALDSPHEFLYGDEPKSPSPVSAYSKEVTHVKEKVINPNLMVVKMLKCPECSLNEIYQLFLQLSSPCLTNAWSRLGMDAKTEHQN